MILKNFKKLQTILEYGIIEGTYNAKSGHPGGSLSCADIITVLFFNQMNLDPNDIKSPKRDRFVLSKGHVAPALSGALTELGYFNKEELKSLRHIGSMLQGHPDMRKTPGVDMSTGSLRTRLISCKRNGNGSKIK